jgi:hypothetical protein
LRRLGIFVRHRTDEWQIPVFNLVNVTQPRLAMPHRRSKPHWFRNQTATHGKRLEQQAARLPDVPDKNALLGKIGQLDTAIRPDDELTSPSQSSQENKVAL